MNCKGAYLVERFIRKVCPCFNILFAHLEYNCTIVVRLYHLYQQWYLFGFRHVFIEDSLSWYGKIIWRYQLQQPNFYGTVIISRVHLKRSILYLFHNIKLQPSIISSGLWLIQKNLWGTHTSTVMVGLSHFSEHVYRRDLCQIVILGGNWHFSWGWFFSGGT